MTWELIEEITLDDPASSIVFNEGLVGYKFFRMTVYLVSSSNGNLDARFNGDSGLNYDYQRVRAAATSVTGTRDTGQDELRLSTGGTGTASNLATMVIAKPTASAPAQVIGLSGTLAPASIELGLVGAEWDNTDDLISQIELIANFAAGTSAMLEGLAF